MIAVVANLVACVLAGIPAARLLRQHSTIARLLSAALLLGIAVQVQVLFLLSCVGLQWTPLSLSLGGVAVNAVVLGLGRRAISGRSLLNVATSAALAAVVIILPANAALAAGALSVLFVVAAIAPRPRLRIDALVVLPLIIVTVTLAGYGLFATLAPPAENDFLFIWGLKARVFLEHQGIDWAFLSNRWNDESHLDYPPFVPLTFDAVLLRDGWNDRAVSLVYIALALASVAQAHALFRGRDGGGRLASLATLGVVTYLTSPWIGLADAFVVTYGGLGLVLLGESLLKGERSDVVYASILIGCAAQSKNEGVILLLAATLASILAVRPLKKLLLLLPAYLLAVPWLLVRIPLRAQTDLLAGEPLARFDLHRLSSIAGALPHLPWTTSVAIAVLVVAIVLAMRELSARKLVIITISLQSFAYLVAFLVTPKDVVWHMHAAFERLVSHIAFPLVAVVMLALLEMAARLQPSVRLPSEE